MSETRPDLKRRESLNDAFRQVLLTEDESGNTVEQAIAKSIAEKASCGDINAIKLLRELMAEQEKDAPAEIRITVVE